MKIQSGKGKLGEGPFIAVRWLCNKGTRKADLIEMFDAMEARLASTAIANGRVTKKW